MDPSDALTLANEVLQTLDAAGYAYHLAAGPLALYVHGVGARRIEAVDLFTETTYTTSFPRDLAAEVLRQRGYQVGENARAGGLASALAGTFNPLRVTIPDRPRQATVVLGFQRMPQNDIAVINGMRVASLRECVMRTLENLSSGNEPSDFIDFADISTYGQQQFDDFLLAYLSAQADSDPTVRPAIPYETFYRLLARIIDHPNAALEQYGRPNPEELRQSVLDTADRVLRAAPGVSTLRDAMHAPPGQVERAWLGAVVQDFDMAFPQEAAIWKEVFDHYLAARGDGQQPFDVEQDYRDHVQGRTRADAVRSLLAARGISIPEGQDNDSPEQETVNGLANRKTLWRSEKALPSSRTAASGLIYLVRLTALRAAVRLRTGHGERRLSSLPVHRELPRLPHHTHPSTSVDSAQPRNTQM